MLPMQRTQGQTYVGGTSSLPARQTRRPCRNRTENHGAGPFQAARVVSFLTVTLARWDEADPMFRLSAASRAQALCPLTGVSLTNILHI